ncbi:MAG: elongation factor P maturation arginine rhamnosyltransferase EarP [Betaproteobacteria bacterium]|nr:elongation factor P maturation arginine rhamnosyltransferase EarP [Betaproteobacteria bacterium]
MKPVSGSQMKWEIFCRAVDNYGDVGVCWRLACALVAEHGVDVRLWVDDWKTLSRVCPQAVSDGARVAGVELRRWANPFPMEEPADVVIEAFSCDLPKEHERAMAERKRPPIWVNLEYLSAEEWVLGCHGLSSPHPEWPLTKTFLFPGFLEGTGGLILEEGLLYRRDRMLEAQSRADWLRAFTREPLREDALVVSLFGYEPFELAELLHYWEEGERPILLLVPEGRSLAGLERVLGIALPLGEEVRRGALRVVALPFTDQEGFDALLWRCDLNLVRGEDSFVRAQWAARPFVWNIYPQKDGAHFVKLDAFLALYSAGLRTDAANALIAFWRAWNGRGDTVAAWPAFVHALPELENHARSWCAALAGRPSLVTTFWQFVDTSFKKLDKIPPLQNFDGLGNPPD